MSTENSTAAPITARKLANGWLYQQAGVTLRKSGKGGDAYAYAVTINGQVRNFCGALKSANSEANKCRAFAESWRGDLARFGTVESYRAHREAGDQANREYCRTQGDEKMAEHLAWFERSVAADWSYIVDGAAWVVAIVPIVVVEA